MNVEPEVEEDTKEYLCPANNSHKLYGEDNFLKHIMRCKDFEGRKFWCCKFQWTHMFHFREERDHHEQFNCDFKRPNVERFKDYFFLSKKQDSPDKAFEKRQNMTNSIYYYEKNKATLEYEKNLRRKLRQKREQEEAARMDQARKLQLQLQENNKYYTKEYVLENAIFINTDWGRFFLVLVAHGDRKIEKRNFEMKTTIDVGDKLQKIGHMEYKKILGGEFIAHPDYVNFFNRLKTTVDTESSLACEDFCESNDELIILTSSKYVPFLPENRLALLVVRKSKFSEPEGRPYHILDNNVSNVFVNEYEMFLDNDVRESEIRGFEGGNAENNTTIVTYEYKLQIEKKLRNIMELIQESISNQNTADQFKRENDQLEALLVDKDSLKAQEKKLAEKEGKIKNELDDYKRKLTHEFLNNVHSRQEELNTKINRYYASKLKELEATDQVSLMLEEEEAELTRKIQDARAEIEGLHKNKKLKENNIAKLEHLVAEKRKNIQISKSLALTNVLDSLCHVCQQNRINILYISCYHFYVCEECQKRASEVGRHECLYCLKPVDKVVRVIV